MSKGISNDKKPKKNKIDFLEVFNFFKKEGHFTTVGKILGKGSFGEVREIVYKNKIMAAKIVMQEKNQKFVAQGNDEKSGEYLAYDLKGRNIIKINKIVLKQYDGKFYYLIIMEKAVLRDLGKLTDFYHNHNLLKLIFPPFDQNTSDNLLRFYALQIMNALELLNRNKLVHFDLKPENLLITINLTIKLSDFSLLRKVDDKAKIKIPGGTNGYVTLEYYEKDEKVSSEVARQQDYFSFGATLYYIKYGKQMLKYKKCEDGIAYGLAILEKLQTEISRICADNFSDQEFISFLVSLIGYKPEIRPTFEEIFRNKWLNRNVQELEDTFWEFECDEEKLIMELQKKDFLIEKEKEINKKPNKYTFKKRNK